MCSVRSAFETRSPACIIRYSSTVYSELVRSTLTPLTVTVCAARSSATAPHSSVGLLQPAARRTRSEEHTSELQSLMRISYAVFCLQKKKKKCTHARVYGDQTLNHTEHQNHTAYHHNDVTSTYTT